MLRLKPVLFFFFILISLASKGEQPIVWYSQDALLKNGVYKNYGLVSEPQQFGVVFNNTTNQKLTYYLKINNPHINRIYVLDSKQDTLFVTGDRYQFNSRPVYFWEYVFPIEINPQSIDSIKFEIHKKVKTLLFMHCLLQKIHMIKYTMGIYIFTALFYQLLFF
jgi:hypothetical protein